MKKTRIEGDTPFNSNKSSSKFRINILLFMFLGAVLTHAASGYSSRTERTFTSANENQQAQQHQERHTVKGVVLTENGEAVIGASIKEQGSKTNGAISDADGKFSIVVPANAVLTVSSVGSLTQNIAVAGKTNLRIMLKEDDKVLSEVVVTGYQTVKKQSQAGSITTLKASDLTLNGTQTLEQALKGQVAGMQVMDQSGLIGTRQKIQVRGVSTLLGNQEPIWVVDGIIQQDPLPFNSNQLADMGNNMSAIRNFVGGAISWLNPEDIENITILKDASSTAIYGVKAANGVIVITTKKGKQGRLSLSYSGRLSTSAKPSYDRLELMNSKERVDYSREGYNVGAIIGSEPTVGYMKYAFDYDRKLISLDEFNTAVKKMETNNTDWFGLMFRNPISQNHNISISGGDSRSTYRASFGYNQARGTAIGNEQNSYNGSLNISSKFWNRLNLSFSLSGSLMDTKGFVGTQPYGFAVSTSRAIPMFNDDGSRYFYNKGGYLYNILNELDNSGNKNSKLSLNSNIQARLTILKGLVYSTTFGINFSNTMGETFRTDKSHFIAGRRGYNYEAYQPGTDKFIQSQLPFGGVLANSYDRNKSFTFRNQLEYNFILKEKHVVNLMAGTEIGNNKYDGLRQENWGYMPDRGKNFTTPPKTYANGSNNSLYRSEPDITDRTVNSVSYYTTMSYMFDERYSINSSIRGDATNRFGQDKNARFSPIWSTGFRWNAHNEHWMKEQNIVSGLSLRVSYGLQGNSLENYGPDLIATLNAADQYGYFTMSISRLPTPGLKMEKSKTLGLGVDWGLLKNRITGTLEYYDRKTEDMIVQYPVPYENGITSMPINGGHMRNYGWDLSVGIVPVQTQDFGVSLRFNIGRVYNQVKTKLQGTGQWNSATGGNLNKEGYPVSSFWAFKYVGLNPVNGAPIVDLTGAKSEEAAQDITGVMRYMGQTQPTLTGGLNINIRYKLLTISSSFYLSTGNKRFLSSPFGNTYKMPDEENNISSELLKRWRKPGDELITNIPGIPTIENNRVMYPFKSTGQGWDLYPYYAWNYSDIRVAAAWYFACKGINVNYRIPTKWISGFAQSIGLNFSVSDVFKMVSKDYQKRDPEVASGQQPLTSNYTFGISASF